MMWSSPDRWFLTLILLFGTAYLFLVPPFQVPDETSHFFRAYHLSEGQLMGTTTADRRLGAELPAGLLKVCEPFRHLRYHYDQQISLDTLRRAARIPLHAKDRIFIDFANTGYYAPFPYLPYALAIAPLRIFRVPPLYLLYAGRLAGLLTWTSIVLLALRRLPYHRWTIAFAMLLPASLFIHAGISGDTLTNALSIWLIASFLYFVYQPGTSFRWSDGLVMLGVSSVLTVSKVVLAPLIALFWLLPYRCFPSRRNYWAWGLLLTGINILLLWLWYQYAGDKFIPYDQYHPQYRDAQQLNPGVQPHAQLSWIAEHPFAYAKVLVLSFWESLPATLAHYTGKFGWEKNYLPAPLIGLLLSGLLTLAVFENQKTPVPEPAHRLFFLILASGISAALATVLYAQWHPVGAPRILVLGGRYFFAIFPLLWLALKWPSPKISQQWLLNGVQGLTFLALAWGVLQVVVRYWEGV